MTKKHVLDAHCADPRVAFDAREMALGVQSQRLGRPVDSFLSFCWYTATRSGMLNVGIVMFAVLAMPYFVRYRAALVLPRAHHRGSAASPTNCS
jgi:hypothetical protein